MRMIPVDSHLRFRWFNVPSEVDVGYAVLSHVWRPSEQSYEEAFGLAQELVVFDDNRVSAKIEGCHRLAEAYKLSWFWVDTPCSDSRNSVQVSESITCMYDWYAHASICFAYLPDVPASDTIRAPNSAFRRSIYFKRGWTLQELIAPRRVVFIAEDWTPIGEKRELADVLEEITGIDKDILTFDITLEDVSVARRLSWASHRQTNRVEDKAYCMLGLFDIQMPLIYGEGDNAFVRLQQTILARIHDHSLLAWSSSSEDSSTGGVGQDSLITSLSTAVFPKSPVVFASASRMIAVDTQSFLTAVMPLCVGSYEDHKLLPRIGPVNPHGVKCRLPVLFNGANPLAALLACQEDSHKTSTTYIALALAHAGRDGPGVYCVGGHRTIEDAAHAPRRQTFSLLRVNLALIDPPLSGIPRILKRPAFHIRFMSFHITNDYRVTDLIPSSSMSIPRWLPFKFRLPQPPPSCARAHTHIQPPAVPVVYSSLLLGTSEARIQSSTSSLMPS